MTESKLKAAESCISLTPVALRGGVGGSTVKHCGARFAACGDFFSFLGFKSG